jgi:hypothetical protein
MAILFVDGFDWFPNEDLSADVNRWTSDGTASRHNAITTNLRNGHGRARQIESGGFISRNVGQQLATIHVAFALKMNTVPGGDTALIYFRDESSTNIFLEITATGAIKLVRGFTDLVTGTTTLSAGTWYHFAIKYFANNSTGTFELRLNGSVTPEINFGPGNTINTSNAYTSAISLRGAFERFAFDDFVIADDTGSQPFLGDYDVYSIFPDGAGASAQFTPSAGSNFENVDENPNDGDTTYNESSTTGHKDRFTMGNVPADTDTIYAVQVGAFAKKTDVGSRELNVLAHDGTTEGAGPDIALTTAYGWVIGMFEDHPSGAAAWTESEVNSMEAGYEVAV